MSEAENPTGSDREKGTPAGPEQERDEKQGPPTEREWERVSGTRDLDPRAGGWRVEDHEPDEQPSTNRDDHNPGLPPDGDDPMDGPAPTG